MVKIQYTTQYGNAPDPIYIKKDSQLQAEHLPSMTHTDYSFMGWKYKDGTIAQVGDIISKGLTLSAYWITQAGEIIEEKSLLDRIIYTDHDRNEINILQNFEIDVDVADKKDFQIKMSADEPRLKAGYYWFVQDEEYGGIIDEVIGNSAENEVQYKGRNARGILACKVVEPLSRTALSGTISEVFNTLIESCSLDELFVADKISDEQYIANHRAIPYKDLYTVLDGIAKSVNCTMKLAYKSEDRRWHITLELINDYSDNLNYCQDNSIQFNTDTIVSAANHIIVKSPMGYVIHLFTDENGGVQPYAFKDEPIEDIDYILDKRCQVIFGLDEYTKFIEASDSIKDGYRKIETQPTDWKNSYSKYVYLEKSYTQTQDTQIQENKSYFLRKGTLNNYTYELVENPKQSDLPLYFEYQETYKEYAAENAEEAYQTITEKPDDWDFFEKTNDRSVSIGKQYYIEGEDEFIPVENPITDDIENYYEYKGQFGSYFYRTYVYREEWDEDLEIYVSRLVDTLYESIEGITIATDRYYPLANIPDDWEDNAISYFIKEDNEYISVQLEHKTYFDLLTVQPTDWFENYRNYYTIKDGSYIPVEPVKVQDELKYPSFRQNKYYSRTDEMVAPPFEQNKYYWQDTRIVAPEWKIPAGKRIVKQIQSGRIPVYKPDNTYLKVSNHYAGLVEAGLQELENSKITQKQEVKLTEFEVNIGDVVGGEDRITGYTITEPVTNIIAKLNKQGISIEYSVGGE